MSDTESNSNVIEIESKSDVRRRRKRIANQMHEKMLESIVFGRESTVFDNISKKNRFDAIDEDIRDIDSRSQQSCDEESDDDINQNEKQSVMKTTDKKSVWSDEDDDIEVANALSFATKLPKRVNEQQRYKDYLESKFSDMFETPKWALKQRTIERNVDESEDSDDSDDSDDDLSKTATHFKVKSKTLDKENLRFKDCKNLNKEHKMKCVLNCVEFHRSSTVALVSSPTGNVTLFQVDGKINAKIQSIYFQKFHIDCARFINGGQELIVGSHKNLGLFYYYDMIAGKIVKIPFVKGKQKFSLGKFVVSDDDKYIASKGNNGYINVLTAKSKEHVFDFKMNGEVTSLTFGRDSNTLLTHGSEGKVYIWDIRSRNCMNRFVDEGCVSGTAIAVSPNQQFCATGSNMGVVNLYNCNDLITKSGAKPLKSIMNLTTEITSLKFNHSSELLFMSSNAKDNSVKCVNMQSLSVYHNFPKQNVNYRRINDLDISLNSGYLSLANNTGTAFLYRLHHFPNY